MIHRAILGSVERFTAILIEHLAGKWPFFLSPRQCIICPISEKFKDYAESVYEYLHHKGYEVQVDFSNLTLNKKIRTHQLEQWNFILVCGEDEVNEGTVDVRSRENERMGKFRVDKLHEHFQSLSPKKSKAYDKFYSHMWNPANYGGAAEASGAAVASGAAAPKSGEKVKLHMEGPTQVMG